MRRSTAFIASSLLAVLLAALIAGLLLVLLSSGGVKSRLGDAVYDAGRAEAIARQADEQPVLLPALVGFRRDILVSHIRGNEFRAFEANPPGTDRRCQVVWRPRTRDFRAPCSGAAYPLDGTGLKQYAAKVDARGHLIIDLRTELTTRTTATRPPVSAPPS
jgi:hypothetical protein